MLVLSVGGGTNSTVNITWLSNCPDKSHLFRSIGQLCQLAVGTPHAEELRTYLNLQPRNDQRNYITLNVVSFKKDVKYQDAFNIQLCICSYRNLKFISGTQCLNNVFIYGNCFIIIIESWTGCWRRVHCCRYADLGMHFMMKMQSVEVVQPQQRQCLPCATRLTQCGDSLHFSHRLSRVLWGIWKDVRELRFRLFAVS